MTSRTTRLFVALGINAALVVGQAVAGAVAHSTGLLADAGHNLTDVVALGASLVALRWAAQPRSAARSFGNHRGPILAALFNSAALALVTVAIVGLSIARLIHPAVVHGGVVIVVAGVALAVNVFAAMILDDGTGELTMRSMFWHMFSDALSAGCVLLGGLIIFLVGNGGWDRVDPIASLVVAILIIRQSYRLTRASVDVLLESTPEDVDLAALCDAMTGVDGVGEVHDLHVWSLSSEVRALSAHLVLTGHPTLEEAQEIGAAVRGRVSGPFELAHTTFELECERCVDDEIDPCEMDTAPTRVDARPHAH